ncbi:MAG TPA: CsgG/HfaB family protein [Bacteroidota bacterium]|nr:CsgG/HfaB family protein [Bacteroidota bacterium]
MKRILLPLLVGSLLCFSFQAEAQLKKRIAISRFEDRSGHGYHGIGQGVADMLATVLVKSGKFMVMERQELDNVIAEQKLGESGLVTAETAPKVGKLLGVELLVVGSISEFGTKENKIGGGVSLFGGGISRKTARAVVDIRLVNTTTGEIIATATEEGSESSTGVSVRYSDLDFNDHNSWDDTDIGKATRQAVDGCAELITENLEKLPWMGRILKVNPDGTLLMKPGSEGAVKVGMEFDILRAGEDVKDPDTGLSLGAEETKIGTIKVIEDALRGKAAKAKIVTGKDVKNTDILREAK